MKPKYLLRQITNILWLLVGGVLGIWIGKNELPWIIVEVLIVAIGCIGINQVIYDARKNR